MIYAATRRLRRLLPAGGFALFGGLVASCFTGSEGLVPPTDAFYFPTAVAVSPGRETLYVVNSDFDLQYNGGTLFAINLGEAGGSGLAAGGTRAAAERVADAIADGRVPKDVCSEVGVAPNDNDTLYPGPCKAITAAPFVRAYATIGGFGTGLRFVGNERGPGMRLFASVRGDPSITYFDVVDDRPGFAGGVAPCDGAFCLSCGGSTDENRCAESHRIGENIFTSQRGLLLPSEPVALASVAGRFGDAIVSTHQTENSAGLVVNRWPAGTSEAGTPFVTTPSLEYVLPELPDAPTGITAIPAPRVVSELDLAYAPGFVLTHRAAPTLTIVRFEADEFATPPRPFIALAESVSVTLTNDGSDARDAAIDDTARRACEADCATDCGEDCEGNALFATCLEECLEVPVGFYLTNRAPSSLIIGKVLTEAVKEDGRIVSIRETISLDESLPLPLGALSVDVGSIIDANGALATRIFASSFDSKFISVYDPVLRRIETTIRTGRGPQSFAFDTDPDGLTSHLYVAQFTDSYVSVIDLDSRRLTYGTALLNLGPTVPPREEQ